MNFDEYQALAERTARRGANDTDLTRFANFGMGIAGEAGEVVDHLKKVVFHGHELDKDKLEEELGDLMWYVATLANTAGLSLEQIAANNVDKLRRRYPDGFSKERSINRQD
jgi:NTP pyrophosphatase (non-canonical NTP hydrolase)